ncbi:MAG: hypothetical protein QM808_18320 [Steroidobacteraceae bacterium]
MAKDHAAPAKQPDKMPVNQRKAKQQLPIGPNVASVTIVAQYASKIRIVKTGTDEDR